MATKTYKALSKVTYDGKDYEAGAELSLDDDTAVALLAGGAIEAKGKAAKAAEEKPAE